MCICTCNIYVWLDLQKPTIMLQELKFKLCHNINDSLMHCPRTSTVWLKMARSAFTDGSVKLSWCITGPVGPLGSTNQNWLGTKLLPMAILIYPVVCVHSCRLLGTQHYCLWSNGKEGQPSVCPPTQPLITAIRDITGVVKKLSQKQQWILHGSVNYKTVAISLLYLYGKSCVATV